MMNMKLLKRIAKNHLFDKYGEYDVWYDLWFLIKDFALPFRITFCADVQSFSFLCLHFERHKRYRPQEINQCDSDTPLV